MRLLILIILLGLSLPHMCFAQQDELAIAHDGSKYGIISLLTGKTILPLKYDSVDVSLEGYIYAKKGKKWSLIDSRTGKRLTSFIYDSLYGLDYYNLFVGKKKERYVLINEQGKEISAYYDIMNNLYAEEALEFISTSTDECIKYDLVNRVVAGCDTMFREIRYNHPPRFKIVGNGEFNGVENTVTGELVIPYKYYIGQEGDYFVVCDSLTKGQAWANHGIMDTLGNIVLSPKQTAGVKWLKKFGGKSSLFRILKDGKYGIFDADTRQYTVPLKYGIIQIPGADSFYGDFVFAQDSTGKYGLVNAYTGETKQPHIYNYIGHNVYQVDIYTTICGNKYGLLTGDGELAVPCEYDYVSAFTSYKYFIVGKDGKQGLYNRKGKLILPIEYDQIDYNVGYADEVVADSIVRLSKGDYSVIYNLETGQNEKSFTYKGQIYLQTDRPVIMESELGTYTYSLVDGLNGEEIVSRKNEMRILDDSLLYAHTYGHVNGPDALTEIINYRSKEVLLSRIDGDISHISGHYFFIFDGDKSTIFDVEKRQNVFPYIYDQIEVISGNTAIVSKNGKQGIIDYKTGETLTPAKYQSIFPVTWFMPP